MRIETPAGARVRGDELQKVGLRWLAFCHVPNHEGWWYLQLASKFVLRTPEGRYVMQPDSEREVWFFLSLDQVYDFVDRATDPAGV